MELSVVVVGDLRDFLVQILANSPNLAQMLSIPYLIILRWVPRLAPLVTAILRNPIWLPPEKKIEMCRGATYIK